MPELQNSASVDKLVCPNCRKALDGVPSECPACGTDLRGLGGTNETLSGVRRSAGACGGLAEGEVIDRRYRILGRLGEGGMGMVFRVEHVRMGKVMALKVLRPDAALDRAALRRFQQEARIVSRLSHPNTVSVFDFGEVGDGSLYMAMEYVPGRDLASLLQETGPLPERRAVLITKQILRSLAEAHDAGVVHRDIKPANVMLLKTREGEDFAKVVDFGIAKLLETARGDKRSATGGADFVGTPNYMSPEQVSGEPLDGRSDLYSVGAMLFELLTGRCLFDGDTPLAVAAKHLTAQPPRLEDVRPGISISPGLQAVLERALAKKPKDRFQSADAMRAALAGTLAKGEKDTGNLGAPPPSLVLEHGIAGRDDWEHFERSLRWKRRLAPVLALASLGAAVTSTWLALRPKALPAPKPVTAEVEPNDGPRTANLIAPGSLVEGFIKRAAKEQGDLDLFEFSIDGEEPVLATVRVSGVPNVNLALDLFARGQAREAQPAGRREDRPEQLPNLGHVDDLFIGGPEALTDLKLKPGRYLVRVSDWRRPGEEQGAPRENSFDPYGLQVETRPVDRFYEAEPNNVLDEAMRLSAARPVFGHSGRKPDAAAVVTTSGSQVVGSAWTDDYYELVLPPGATTGCAVLAGAQGATLSFSVVGTDLARARALPEGPEREKALAEQSMRYLREKPARVPGGEAQARCARAQETVTFKVQAAEGGSDGTYVLAAFDDSEDGFAGTLAACEDLVASGKAATCRKLLGAALKALPVSRSAEVAKDFLGRLPP